MWLGAIGVQKIAPISSTRPSAGQPVERHTWPTSDISSRAESWIQILFSPSGLHFNAVRGFCLLRLRSGEPERRKS